MRGGTAETYKNWERIGQPYMRNKVYYIKVKKSAATHEKEVRFYTDEKHFNICHDTFEGTPLFKLFGFENISGSIYMIYDKFLSEEEKDKYFKGSHGKWMPCVNTKGIFWRSSLTTDLPPIRNVNKITKIDWAAFKKEQIAYSKKEFDKPIYWKEEN